MRRTVVIIVVILVVLGGGYYVAKNVLGHKTAAPTFALATATRGNLTVDVTASGTIQPAKTENVAPSASGTLNGITVSVGSKVTTGEVLATVNDNGAAQSRLASAKATISSDLASLNSLLSPTPPSAQTIQSAKDKLNVDEARYAQDQSDQAKLTASAPEQGVLSAVNVQAGQQVNAGSPLFTVSSAATMTVQIDVPEPDMQSLQLGEPATASALGTGAMTASVTSIGAAADGSGRLGPVFPVTVTIPNPDQGLRAGMAAQVSIPASNVAASGTLAYGSSETVTAGVSGTVATVSGTVGQDVNAGQQIVTLSDSSLSLTLQSDQATIAQDQANLDSLLNPTPPDPQKVTSLRERLTADQVSLTQAEQALGNLELKSPVNGTVTAVNVKNGDQTSSTTGAAFVVQSLSDLQVSVPVTEVNISQVKIGQAAAVTTDAFPGQTFQGKVAQIDPSGTNSQGVATFNVLIDLQSPAGLKPGMSASVSVQVAAVKNAILIPVEAVTGSGKSATVRVLVNGRPVPRRVTTGLSNDVSIQIVSGLKVGDSVVTATAPTGNTSPGGGRGGRGGGGFRPGAVRRIGG